MSMDDNVASPQEPSPEHVGWHCACGHPNGINLSVCACCGRTPGGPENPITTIYRQPQEPSATLSTLERLVMKAQAAICHATDAADGKSCRDKYGVDSWCSACVQHELVAALRPSEGPETGRLRQFIAAWAGSINPPWVLEGYNVDMLPEGKCRWCHIIRTAFLDGKVEHTAWCPVTTGQRFKLNDLQAALAALPAGPETGDRERLRALAVEGARRLHNAGTEEQGHVSPYRFETCPHPDCVLVRQAAPAASEGDR